MVQLVGVFPLAFALRSVRRVLRVGERVGVGDAAGALRVVATVVGFVFSSIAGSHIRRAFAPAAAGRGLLGGDVEIHVLVFFRAQLHKY